MERRPDAPGETVRILTLLPCPPLCAPGPKMDGEVAPCIAIVALPIRLSPFVCPAWMRQRMAGVRGPPKDGQTNGDKRMQCQDAPGKTSKSNLSFHPRVNRIS